MSSKQPVSRKIKVVLLGEISTGKTNIITKLVKDTFNESNQTTDRPSSLSKQYHINNNTYTINYWDTAGQEKFRSVNKIFYRSAQVVLFIYSIIDKASFQAIESYWTSQIKQELGDKVGMI